MWKKVSLSVAFGSVFLLLAALQDCASASGVPFHGYIPLSNVKAPKPRGDNRPNDIYAHLPVRRRELSEDELIIHPRFPGYDKGKDSEHKVYEIFTIKELITQNSRKHSKKHHGYNHVH